MQKKMKYVLSNQLTDQCQNQCLVTFWKNSLLQKIQIQNVTIMKVTQAIMNFYCPIIVLWSLMLQGKSMSRTLKYRGQGLGSINNNRTTVLLNSFKNIVWLYFYFLPEPIYFEINFYSFIHSATIFWEKSMWHTFFWELDK